MKDYPDEESNIQRRKVTVHSSTAPVDADTFVLFSSGYGYEMQLRT